MPICEIQLMLLVLLFKRIPGRIFTERPNEIGASTLRILRAKGEKEVDEFTARNANGPKVDFKNQRVRGRYRD